MNTHNTYRTRACMMIAGLTLGLVGSSAIAQQVQPEKRPKGQTLSQSGTASGSLPTSTPYPKLAVKNDEGMIIRLVQLPDIAALRSNPTIGQKSVEAIMPVIYGRRARFERILLENLDLYWMVTDGRIEEMSFDNMKGVNDIAEMIKPLVGRTTLSKELLNRGILSRTQGGMNEHIVNEYKNAVTAEIQFESDTPMLDVMKFMLYDTIQEPAIAYRAMVAELSTQVSDAVSKAGIESSEATKALIAMEQPLDTDPEAQDKFVTEFESKFRALSVDDAIAVLTAMRSERKNADVSPLIQTPNVMHSRKIDISESGAMQGEIIYHNQGGRKVTTQELKEEYDAKKAAEKEALKEQQGDE